MSIFIDLKNFPNELKNRFYLSLMFESDLVPSAYKY